MRYYLSPSLMCMDMMKLTEQLRFLNSKADRLHVDIMDGHYVKNLALSASFVAQIRPYTSLPIDVHLMVEAPASFIPALLDAGADAFSLHPETICREAFRVINMLRQAGKEVGMVLNPATPVESIQHYLHLLDKVTVMTVDPGYAGQPFIPEMLAKITQLHQLKETGSLRFLLAAGFSGDLRRGKNRGHLVDEPSESGDAARNVCPGRHRPVTDCRFQRFNAGGLCAHSGQLLYGAMLADELWSGDQRDGERYPDRRLDRGDVDYRRGRNSAGDGHYLGYERRQYANRLYRSAPVLCVCRFLRLLVRA